MLSSSVPAARGPSNVNRFLHAPLPPSDPPDHRHFVDGKRFARIDAPAEYLHLFHCCLLFLNMFFAVFPPLGTRPSGQGETALIETRINRSRRRACERSRRLPSGRRSAPLRSRSRRSRRPRISPLPLPSRRPRCRTRKPRGARSDSSPVP